MKNNLSNTLFPIFLKLEKMRVLVVGGRNVAHEKLTGIVANSPQTKISVVAIEVSDEVKKLVSAHPNIQLHVRAFEKFDVDNADVIIAAANNIPLANEILELAHAQNKLVNVADTPDLCDFYLSSIVQKGHLKMAISTNGKSPTTAKRLKEVFHEALPDELDDVIENLHTLRGKLDGDFEKKVKKLNQITKVLLDDESTQRERNFRRIATYSLIAFALMIVGHLLISYVPWAGMADSTITWMQSLDKNFAWMVLAGFAAQLVDGSLGMGYGLVSATILLSTGINLAAISGSIHTAEMFASGASGYSHYKFGNVDKKLFRKLVIPGVIGAVLGALALSLFGDTYGAWMRPALACYILFLGVKYIVLAFQKTHVKGEVKHIGRLAGAGGFLDSFGGGGWGPLVTSTLLRHSDEPRKVIGSVSLTEFFVTLASAFTFFTIIGISHWHVIVALIIGGLVAAPIGARLAGRLNKRTSFILIGIIATIWSVRILWKTFM
ncbi:MAG: TSUP family transporter [Flavobacteriales bacterium]|nr:TSUP family transporter [Flavobacteriales bacterium]